MVKSFWKSKTFWAALGGIVTAIGGWATGEIELGSALQTVTTSAIGFFLRSAIGRVETASVPAPPVLEGVEKSAPVAKRFEMPRSGDA